MRGDNSKVDILLNLYKEICEEERYYVERFFNHLKFFWSIASFMFTGFAVGIYKAGSSPEYVLLYIIPIALIKLANFFKSLTTKDYRRFIEAIILKSKIEAMLSLDKWNLPEDSEYWKGERFLHFRHLEDRRKFGNSKEFQEFFIENAGSVKIYHKIFNFVRFTALLLMLYLTLLILYDFVTFS